METDPSWLKQSFDSGTKNTSGNDTWLSQPFINKPEGSNPGKSFVDQLANASLGLVDAGVSTVGQLATFPAALAMGAYGHLTGQGKERADQLAAIPGQNFQPGMLTNAIRGLAGLSLINPQDSMASKYLEPVNKAFETLIPSQQIEHNLGQMKELGINSKVADAVAFGTSKFIELMAFGGYHQLVKGAIGEIKGKLKDYQTAKTPEAKMEAQQELNKTQIDVLNKLAEKGVDTTKLQSTIQPTPIEGEINNRNAQNAERTNLENQIAAQKQNQLQQLLNNNVRNLPPSEGPPSPVPVPPVSLEPAENVSAKLEAMRQQAKDAIAQQQIPKATTDEVLAAQRSVEMERANEVARQGTLRQRELQVNLEKNAAVTPSEPIVQEELPQLPPVSNVTPQLEQMRLDAKAALDRINNAPLAGSDIPVRQEVEMQRTNQIAKDAVIRQRELQQILRKSSGEDIRDQQKIQEMRQTEPVVVENNYVKKMNIVPDTDPGPLVGNGENFKIDNGNSWAGFEVGNDNVVVHDVFVDKSDRKKGLGSQMLSTIEEANPGKDIYIGSTNKGMDAVAEKAGYELVSPRKQILEDGIVPDQVNSKTMATYVKKMNIVSDIPPVEKIKTPDIVEFPSHKAAKDSYDLNKRIFKTFDEANQYVESVPDHVKIDHAIEIIKAGNKFRVGEKIPVVSDDLIQNIKESVQELNNIEAGLDVPRPKVEKLLSAEEIQQQVIAMIPEIQEALDGNHIEMTHSKLRDIGDQALALVELDLSHKIDQTLIKIWKKKLEQDRLDLAKLGESFDADMKKGNLKTVDGSKIKLEKGYHGTSSKYVDPEKIVGSYLKPKTLKQIVDNTLDELGLKGSDREVARHRIYAEDYFASSINKGEGTRSFDTKGEVFAAKDFTTAADYARWAGEAYDSALLALKNSPFENKAMKIYVNNRSAIPYVLEVEFPKKMKSGDNISTDPLKIIASYTIEGLKIKDLKNVVSAIGKIVDIGEVGAIGDINARPKLGERIKNLNQDEIDSLRNVAQLAKEKGKEVIDYLKSIGFNDTNAKKISDTINDMGEEKLTRKELRPKELDAQITAGAIQPVVDSPIIEKFFNEQFSKREMVKTYQSGEDHYQRQLSGLSIDREPQVTGKKMGSTLISPHNTFWGVFEKGDNPSTDVFKCHNTVTRNIDNGKKWTSDVLKDIPEMTSESMKILEPFFKKFQDRFTERAEIGRIDKTLKDQIKNLTGQKKQDMIEKWKQNKSRFNDLKTLTEDMITEWDTVVPQLAEKESSVRVILAAADLLPTNIKLSDVEMNAARRIREYFDSTREDMKSLGMPVEEGPFMPRLFKPIVGDQTAESGFIKAVTKTPAMLKMITQMPDGRPWLPDAHQILESYIPIIERELAYNPFLQRWKTFIDAKATPELRQYMQKWINENLYRKPESFMSNINSAATALEFARIIGLSVPVAFKHLTKIGGTLAQYDNDVLVKAMIPTIKVTGQSLKDKFGGKVEGRELDIFRSYVKVRDIVKTLDESPLSSLLDRTKAILGSPVATIEAFDNGLSVFSAILQGAKEGKSSGMTERALIKTILDVNFRGGWDQPLWLKSQVARWAFMFQATPFKATEMKYQLIKRTWNNESDAFGTKYGGALVKYATMIGAAEMVARANDTSLLDLIFHVPFTQGMIKATKKGYEFHNPNFASSPFIQLANEMTHNKEGAIGGARKQYGLDKNFIPTIKSSPSLERYKNASEGKTKRYESVGKMLLGLKPLER